MRKRQQKFKENLAAIDDRFIDLEAKFLDNSRNLSNKSSKIEQTLTEHINNTND